MDVGNPVPRYVSVAGKAGVPIAHAPAVEVKGRGRRVVPVAALASELHAAVKAAQGNLDAKGHERPFTSAELALQLTAGAEAVRFEVAP